MSDWIEWTGGENPVPGRRVEVQTRGERERGIIVKDPRLSESFVWARRSDGREKGGDIIAYRLASPPADQPADHIGEVFAALVEEARARLSADQPKEQK